MELQNKINRKQSPEQVLQEVLSILKNRDEQERVHNMNMLIQFLEYQPFSQKNTASTNKIKDAIIASIPKICDSVDSLDYTYLINTEEEIIYARPKNTYPGFGYDMEKIFGHLNGDIFLNNQEFEINRVNSFSKQFAKKWVDIDIDSMTFDEIKLLIRCACYLEAKEEEQQT